MGTIAERNPRQDIIERVRAEDFRAEIRLALPENISVDRFIRATVTALLTNPKLAEVERGSLFQAILKCAQDGLMPDGREAALLDFKVKGVPSATYLPMVGGFRKIAGEYGWVLRSEVVYEHDEFEYALGLTPHVTHRPARVGTDRGRPVAAYAVAVSRDGRKEFEVMDAAEIEKVRQTSRAKDHGPWQDWTERMWEKTAARRLFKKLPFDPADQRIARVIDADSFEPGKHATVLYGPEALPEGSSPSVAMGGGDGTGQSGTVEAPPPPVPAPDPDADSIPFGEPEPGPVRPPYEDALADAAARFVPPTGKYADGGTDGPLTLKEILAVNDGWILWALRNIEKPAEYVQALELFARRFAPESWQKVAAERETRA